MGLSKAEIDKLIIDHRPLAKSLAREQSNAFWDFEDLEGVALLKLGECQNSWDPKKGTFGTYASKCIKNALIDWKTKRDNTQGYKNIPLDDELTFVAAKSRFFDAPEDEPQDGLHLIDDPPLPNDEEGETEVLSVDKAFQLSYESTEDDPIQTEDGLFYDSGDFKDADDPAVKQSKKRQHRPRKDKDGYTLYTQWLPSADWRDNERSAASEFPNPEQALIINEQLDKLGSILTTALINEEQDVIGRLYWSDRLNYSEVGKAIGRSDKVVKRIERDALSKLRREFDN